MRILIVTIVEMIFVLSIVGCISPCPQIDPQQAAIAQLDDPMIPLAKAFNVIADRLLPDTKDEAVFKAVVERTSNPSLLVPFTGYKLNARIQNGVGVILLCSGDGKEGIIEDVTCTTRPDTHRPSGSPCAALCNKTG